MQPEFIQLRDMEHCISMLTPKQIRELKKFKGFDDMHETDHILVYEYKDQYSICEDCWKDITIPVATMSFQSETIYYFEQTYIGTKKDKQWYITVKGRTVPVADKTPHYKSWNGKRIYVIGSWCTGHLHATRFFSPHLPKKGMLAPYWDFHVMESLYCKHHRVLDWEYLATGGEYDYRGPKKNKE